jgi:hypothetical protein
MLKFTKRRRGFVLLGVIAAVVIAGAAIAYWTAGGTGTGTGSTSAGTSNVTVNQTKVLSAMFPGDSPQTLSGNFDNTNPGKTYIGTVTASIASVTKGGSPAAGCTSADFDLQNAAMTVNAEIAQGTSVGSWSGATIQFKNDPTANQDACKGVTVNLSYSVS